MIEQAKGKLAERLGIDVDVDVAFTEGLSRLDSLLGTHPRWAVVAGR